MCACSEVNTYAPADASAKQTRLHTYSCQRVCVQELRTRFLQEDATCQATTEYEDTNQVQVRALAGLWVVLAAATVGAFVFSGGQVLVEQRWKKRHADSDPDRMVAERAQQFARALSSVVSVPGVSRRFSQSVRLFEDDSACGSVRRDDSSAEPPPVATAGWRGTLCGACHSMPCAHSRLACCNNASASFAPAVKCQSGLCLCCAGAIITRSSHSVGTIWGSCIQLKWRTCLVSHLHSSAHGTQIHLEHDPEPRCSARVCPDLAALAPRHQCHSCRIDAVCRQCYVVTSSIAEACLWYECRA